MTKKIYLLDANIIIKVWNQYPSLLDIIEKSEEIDFKIHQQIAGELARKEFKEINGVYALSNRFIKLLNHIINDTNSTISTSYGDILKYDSNNNKYFINGNKISENDFSLIHICEIHKEYILVTEDKRIINSAKIIIGSSRVLTFKEFMRNFYAL